MGYYFNENNAPIGLTTSTVDSLGYMVAEIERHLHNENKCLGYNAAAPAAGGINSTVAFSLTGGSGAFGTEIQITDGTVIESGSATKKFDIGQVNFPTIGTANRNTLVELNYGTVGAQLAATTQDAGDTLTRAGHSLANGTQVMLDTIVTSTGIDTVTAYYVVGSTAGTTNTTFQLSLTQGGAAVAITSNGTCNYRVITKSILTTMYVCSANNTPQQLVVTTPCPRITCDKRIWMRAWSQGGTNALGVLFNYHVYAG